MRRKLALLNVIALVVAAGIGGALTTASASAPTSADGSFQATIDPQTFSLTPVGENCLLQVDGELTFSGTIEGGATGTTQALVFASCADAAEHPPGTFRDVFMSELKFSGTINGVPATADMTYQGHVHAGGDTDALVRLSNGVRGVLHVDATVAVGGDYQGFVQVH